MTTYENFETTANRSIKVTTDTRHHNTLCLRPNCYSNCETKCTLPFTFVPEKLKSCAVMRNGSCTKCHHPAVEHRHHNYIWTERTESEVTVDEDAKRRFHSASQDKITYEGAVHQAHAVIKDLNDKIGDLKVNIGMFCNSYKGLSLSGGVSGQISQSVRLLELNLQNMQANGTDTEKIQTAEENIQKMQLKQKLVDDAATVVELYKNVCTTDLRIYNMLTRISISSQKTTDLGKISWVPNPQRSEFNTWLPMLIRAYEEFQRIMNKPTQVKVHSDTQYHNTLCLWPQCYSSCHSKCHDASFSFDSEFYKSCVVMEDGRCTTCHHPMSDHRHCRANWEKQTNLQVFRDKDLNLKLKTLKKLYSASDTKRMSQVQGIQMALESRIKEAEKAIKLDLQLENLKTEVGTLCSLYQALSLLGGFSRQGSDSTRLFKLHHGAFQARGDEPTSKVLRALKECIESLESN
jgi:hypothetical protein